MLNYYCIASCDKCRTARKLLVQKEIAHKEIDFRKDGLDRAVFDKWVADYGLDAVLNRKSATWRGLDEAQKAQVESAPYDVIMSNPAMLRRPLLDFGDHILTQKDALSFLKQA